VGGFSYSTWSWFLILDISNIAHRRTTALALVNVGQKTRSIETRRKKTLSALFLGGPCVFSSAYTALMAKRQCCVSSQMVCITVWRHERRVAWLSVKVTNVHRHNQARWYHVPSYNKPRPNTVFRVTRLYIKTALQDTLFIFILLSYFCFK